MITLALLIFFEFTLWVTVSITSFPLIVESLIISLLLISVGYTAYLDAGSGFLGRFCVLLAAGYLFYSLGRWEGIINPMQTGLPDFTVEISALALNLIAPLAILIAPIWRLSPRYDYFRGQ